MVFNNKIKFLVRILILSVGIFAFIYSALILHSFIKSIFALAYTILSISEMLLFMNKTNNDFISFLNALIYEDFTNYYSKSRKHDQDVYSLFNQLNEKYRKIAFEKEVQHAFLQTIIRHINIGVLVLDKEGGVVLVNSYFLRLLNVKSVK